MAGAPDRAHVEDDVRIPILEVLRQGGCWTTRELTDAVRRRLNLMPADLEAANKRISEQKIDQIIANALQDKRYLCRQGLIERVGKGEFQLTEIGENFLRKFNDRVAFGSAWLSENYPDLDEE